MDYVPDTKSTEGRSQSGALAAAAELARQVAAEPGVLREGLRETTRFLVSELDLTSLVLEVRIGSEWIRVSAGATDGGPEPLEVPVLRDKLKVGRMLASLSQAETPGYSLENGEDKEVREVHEVQEALTPVADVISLAVSTAEAQAVAAQRASQGSVVQLASEALSRTFDEYQIHRTVLSLAIELFDSRAGMVSTGEGDLDVNVGFEDSPEALEALGEAEPSRKGWRGQVKGGYAVGVTFSKQEGSIFLFRDEQPYEASDLTSLKLVARQLSFARERGKLYTALEKRDLEAILALSAALESRDGTTGDHINRTQSLAESVALDLGLGEAGARAARYSAILHDIGKIGVPDAILNKPGALDEEEWEVMRRHPAMGAEILGSIAGFDHISEVVLAHHERFDGGGYPAGLSGESIPVEARIISVVDAYDAMTNDRPYRGAMSHETALGELERNAGTQFDPAVIESTGRVIGRGITGITDARSHTEHKEHRNGGAA